MGDTPELGSLQKRILKHFFECERLFENVNHLARALKVRQSAVYKNMNLLVTERYMRKGIRFKRGSKPLRLTDKGAAAAVTLGFGSYNEWLKYYTKTSPTQKETKRAKEEYFDKFEAMFDKADRRDLIVQIFMEFSLRNNLFDKKGRMRTDKISDYEDNR